MSFMHTYMILALQAAARCFLPVLLKGVAHNRFLSLRRAVWSGIAKPALPSFRGPGDGGGLSQSFTCSCASHYTKLHLSSPQLSGSVVVWAFSFLEYDSTTKSHSSPLAKKKAFCTVCFRTDCFRPTDTTKNGEAVFKLSVP